MATIHDVAQKAGVSVASVSRTFSAPELMNDHTRQRVLDAARVLDYRPRQRRTPVETRPANRAIGFQFFAADAADNLQSNDFYAPMLAGAQSEAAALGLHFMLHTTDRRAMRQEMPRMILERAVSGVLLVGTGEPSVIAAFAKHVPQIVLLDNRDETAQYESVLSDGFGGGYSAVQHLLALGHRRIACYVMAPEVTTFRDRVRGFWAAIREAGPGRAGGQEAVGRDQIETAVALTRLLQSPQPPTAVFAANDAQAMDVIRTARQLGLKVPADLSLIGFDDIPFSTHLDPPLTTMRVNKEFMGRIAVRRLHARMQDDRYGDGPEPVVNTLLPVTLVRRESCRSVRNAAPEPSSKSGELAIVSSVLPAKE